MVTASVFQPDPTLFPFESRWFESDVGRVHYIDEGAGPPILFLHGNPTWSFLYRGIVIRLRKRFRCIAVDYPGFGLSAHPVRYGYTPDEHADVVAALVSHLDLRELTVMGQDWGGPIGMRVAIDHAPRIRALVMGNTWYWQADSMLMRAFGGIMSSGLVQRWILQKNFFVERVIPVGVQHSLAPEVMEHYRRVFPTPQSRAGVAEFPRQILRSGGWLREIADAVPTSLGDRPLLLTWGINDLAFSPAFMDRFRADFDSVHVIRLDAKHYIQEDAPAEISEAIEKFLVS